MQNFSQARLFLAVEVKMFASSPQDREFTGSSPSCRTEWPGNDGLNSEKGKGSLACLTTPTGITG